MHHRTQPIACQPTGATSSCSAGTYYNVVALSCRSCSAGTYSAAGAFSCTNCPAGTFSNADKTGCNGEHWEKRGSFDGQVSAPRDPGNRCKPDSLPNSPPSLGTHLVCMPCAHGCASCAQRRQGSRPATVAPPYPTPRLPTHRLRSRHLQRCRVITMHCVQCRQVQRRQRLDVPELPLRPVQRGRRCIVHGLPRRHHQQRRQNELQR